MISNFVFNPNQQYLFKRSYSLSIGKPYQTAALQYSNFPTIGSDGKKIAASPLRLAFEFEKNALGTPNKGKFDIYNLTSQARNQIQKGDIVQLQAGYSGLVETLFIGNVSTKGMKTERKGPDIVLSFECGDGESAITGAVLDKSYPPGSTLAQVLSDIAKAMALPSSTNPQGITVGTVVGIPNITYGDGLAVHGGCRDTLNTLLEPLGLKWSVQNLALTIVPKDAYNGAEAILVSKETGMIGVPSKNEFLNFTSLLNPKLVPNALVQLVSDNTALNGFYKINKAKYEGDTHDNKWQVQCECVIMPNVVQGLPRATGFDFTSAVV